MAKILIIEPFFGGSHKQWAEGWQKHSQHQIKLLTLSAHHWKWRMHGAAVTLADRFLKMDFDPDWIVATDMLDFATFLSLTRKKSNGIATAIYFHENQLSYPWSPADEDKNMQRDNHYMFINYTSALVADLCLFNSSYHRWLIVGICYQLPVIQSLQLSLLAAPLYLVKRFWIKYRLKQHFFSDTVLRP